MVESFWNLVAADALRYRRYCQARFGYSPATWFLDAGFLCTLIHRTAHSLHERGWRKLAWIGKQLNSVVSGADIEPHCRFGPGLLIPHPHGVTLSAWSGSNLTVHSRAGCGGSVQSNDAGAGPGLPVLGDNVRLGEFCGNQGGIRIGSGAVIEGGAGSLVDVPPGGRGVLASEPLCTEPDSEQPQATPVPTCAHGSWSKSWSDWKADVDRLCQEIQRYEGQRNRRLQWLTAALSISLSALLVHRLSHWLHVRGWKLLARTAASINLLIFKLAIVPRTCLGPGVLMPHLSAVMVDGVTGPAAVIYANCVISGIGRGQPIAGAGLALGGHAGVIGPIRVGDEVRLAPKVQLTCSAPQGAQAFSPMSRVKRLEAGEYEPPVPHQQVPPSPASPWREWRRCRAADRTRLRSVAPDAPFAAGWSVALFRLASALWQGGHHRSSRWLWRANMYLTGVDFASDAVVGAGLVVPYPAGVDLFASAGENLTMHAQSMAVAEVDAPKPRSRLNAPIIGSGVTLDPHSGIVGPVRIGDGVNVHPGCIVRRDIADHSTVAPRPLKIRVSPTTAAAPKR